MKKIIYGLFALAVLPCLQSCIAAVAAGAAATGAVAYNQQKVTSINDDSTIRHKVYIEYSRDPDFAGSHISVSSFDQKVLLTGQAKNENVKAKAESLARNVPGIKAIFNQITIGGPISAMTKTSDAWITTKVKSLMLTTKDLKSGAVKVVTENGSVYLIGYVSQYQADMAVDVARGVSGVQKVVKIFDYKTTNLS